MTLVKHPIFYRCLISGLINLLTCIVLSVFWDSEVRGIFVFAQIIYPGFLLGYILSVDTKDSIRAWSFILAVGFFIIGASLHSLHSIFSDDGSGLALILAFPFSGLFILSLFKFLINRSLFLFRAVIAFLPLSIAIGLIPAIALYFQIGGDYQNVLFGILLGASMLLWQSAFAFVCIRFSPYFANY